MRAAQSIQARNEIKFPKQADQPADPRRRGRSLWGWISFALNVFASRRTPISLVHFVTERCNARCAHCFIDFDNQPRREEALSIDDIRRLTTTFGGNLMNVYLTGGEPFLRKDMAEIVKAYAENAGARSIFLTTNGFYTDQTRRFAEEILEANIDAQLFITFSIDDLEEGHDKNRKIPGLFQKTIATYQMIKNLSSDRINSNIAITVTPANHDHVETIYRHLRDDLGIRSITAIAMRDEGIQKINRENRMKIWRGYDKLSSLINADNRRWSNSGYHKSLMGHFFNAKNLVFYPIQRDIYVDPRYVAPCRAGGLFGVIMANGDVFPCEILEDRKLGNLLDYDLDFLKLWRDGAAADTRRFIKDTNCHCSFECAWSTNIVSNPRYLPALAAGTIRSATRSKSDD